MSEVLKVVFEAVYRVMLLMSEVLKMNSFIYYVLHCMNKKIKEYVKGVIRSWKYTVRAVMLCMSKVLNETQNTL